MSQLLRQIGVVIGLTVILTFPVTVVSGAGSQKQPDHMAGVAVVTGGKGQVHGTEWPEPARRSLAGMSPCNSVYAQPRREGDVCNSP